jgi:quercetin dioxygenase-like cupin family protein
MEAQAQVYGPVATRVAFENDAVRVWEMDLAPGEVCGTHHHTLDYVLYILSGAEIGVESPGRRSFSFPVSARSTYYIPAGGIESAHNVGRTRFFEALFEIKRPMREGRVQPGFVGCEALAGREPEPGVLTVIDNDRVRVIETTLAPGGQTGWRRLAHDAAAYVAEGGRVRIAEKTPDGTERSRDETIRPGHVAWLPRGTERNVVNIGTGRIRHVMVEVK